MLLLPGGMDIFYIDESHDNRLYAVTAVTVPFLRNDKGVWQIVWPDHLAAAKEWRKAVSKRHKIPLSKELHGVKFAGGRGNYLFGSRNFTKEESVAAYREILSSMTHIQDSSVITVIGERGHEMFGEERLRRVMYALFQRMRKQGVSRSVNAMVFFDQGHPEYRSLYRQAQVYLPTGSQYGNWGQGSSQNLPLSMFVKDGNDKISSSCLFTQTADIIAYAAFSKAKAESGMVAQTQNGLSLDVLYGSVPERMLNKRASPQQDGIVRLR